MVKTINKKGTIQNILDKCNSSIGTSINVQKFNERSNDDTFLIECANFLNVPVEYK
jgi:hypothetical protein